jgi:uncharacterized protein YodC (DUF2158 family)
MEVSVSVFEDYTLKIFLNKIEGDDAIKAVIVETIRRVQQNMTNQAPSNRVYKIGTDVTLKTSGAKMIVTAPYGFVEFNHCDGKVELEFTNKDVFSEQDLKKISSMGKLE